MNTEHSIKQTKQYRQSLDAVLQDLKGNCQTDGAPPHRQSRERSLAITKLQEAIMWLGMDLKAINEECPGACETPYPSSYDPSSTCVEPTADGLKL